MFHILPMLTLKQIKILCIVCPSMFLSFFAKMQIVRGKPHAIFFESTEFANIHTDEWVVSGKMRKRDIRDIFKTTWEKLKIVPCVFSVILNGTF